MDDLNPITRTERLLDGEDLTPTNREEMFIKRIYDKTQEIPEPVNRKEYFLKKAGEAGGDVTVVPLSVTDNGIYSEEGKAYSPVTVEVAPPEDSYQLKSITTPTPLATFEASEMPMPTLKVSVEAKQDLHGYDKPWVGGAGKNKLPNAIPKTETINGITYKLDEYGVFTITGTSTDTSECTFNLAERFVILSGEPNPKIAFNNTIATSNVYFQFYNGATQVENWRLFPDNRVSEYTAMQGIPCTAFKISVSNAGVTINMKLSPMIVENSVTDYTFAPYSNICPISGWDNAIVTDTDDVDNPTVTQTTTISLGQTVYGGEVDVVNGVLKITYELKRADSLTWQKNSSDITNYLYFTRSLIDVIDINKRSDVKCSEAMMVTNYPATEVGCYVHTNGICYLNFLDAIGTNDLSSFNNFLTTDNVTILIPLATPIIINLTPSLIKSLNGTNNLSVDCGEVIEGEYFKALGGE